MQELEEDPEVRAKMALYRDPKYDPVAEAERRAAAMTDDEDGDVPEVPLEELLDDLAGLQLDEEEQEDTEQHNGSMQQ
jgi:nonsense-mediated mRNA decay protein 3